VAQLLPVAQEFGNELVGDGRQPHGVPGAQSLSLKQVSYEQLNVW
jgi:hypothetical protein